MLDYGRDGAEAEFTIALPNELVPKPRTLDFVQAAAVPLTALTAWQALFEHAGLTAGQTVLIHWTLVAVVLKSRWMTGSATLTTEPSIKAMLDPRMVATRTHSPTRGALGAVSGAERMTPSSQGAFTKVARGESRQRSPGSTAIQRRES